MQNIPLTVLAVILPPFAVGFRAGAGYQFILNLILTLAGFIPGVIHAVWFVNRSDEDVFDIPAESTEGSPVGMNVAGIV